MSAFYRPPASCQIPGLARIYEELFGQKSDGVFLEIGAFDGETCSNTSFLADLGWEGYYVEPVMEYAQRCRQRHKGNDKVKIAVVAVGDFDGQSEISIGGVLTSLAGHHIEAFKNLAWAKGYHRGDIRTVPVVTPTTLLTRLGLGRIDLMIVDVEGFELPIFRAFDFSRWRPSVIIVETRDLDPNFPPNIVEESKEMLRLILEAGYEVHWRDHGNVVLRSVR
jgi:FkbM family methyltransferase